MKSGQIPEVALDSGVSVRVICGTVNGTAGPVTDIVTDPEYLDVSVPANAVFRRGVRRGYNAFAYVIEGRAYFDQRRDAYDLEVVGANYFDFKRDCLLARRNVSF